MKDPLIYKHSGANSQKAFEKQFDSCKIQYNRIKQKNDLMQKTAVAELDRDIVKQYQKQGAIMESQITSLNNKLKQLTNQYRNPQYQNKIKYLKKDFIKQIQRHKVLMTEYLTRASGSFVRNSGTRDSGYNQNRNRNTYGKNGNKTTNSQKSNSYQVQPKQPSQIILSQQDNTELIMEMQAQRQKMEVIKEIQQRMDRVQKVVIDASQEVHKQGDDINLISNNLNQANNNVQKANEELDEAATYQNKSKKKYIICLGIIIILALLIGGLAYLFLK